MWKMFDADFDLNVDCGTLECGGPGPPPDFFLPPPPRPPFLSMDIIKCSEDSISLESMDKCEAIPILDASYQSGPSLQTSAMIILSSVILVLIILISSLLVWKHKRKVQNFLPCKTPTRGHPLETSGHVSGHSVTYEDPDAHLGHRPLVMRHHHNIEMIHPKALHFPSGFPMTRSPPLFVCSSPGPDPYRSHDNVYEELGPPHSDVESEPPLHSDDDFAEDELSLPGDRSFQKSSADNTTVATIYHERPNGTTNSTNGSANINNFIERTLNERNSLLSSTSSGASTAAENNRSTGSGGSHGSSAGSRNNNSSPHVFRSRKIYNRDNATTNRKCYAAPQNGGDDLNTSTEQSDIVAPTTPASTGGYSSDRVNIMTLPLITNTLTTTNLINNNNNLNNNSNSLIVNNNINNNNLNINGHNYSNNELNSNSVSTIYRDRMLPTISAHNYQLNNHHRSRTNPRSLERRQHQNARIMNCNNVLAPTDSDQGYGYNEPVFHEGLLYDACISAHHPNRATPVYHPYILPEFTTFRTLGNPPNVGSHHQQGIYSRDSSFGSDSGYSHHTQTSNRGGGVGCGSNSGGGFIGATFGWGRRLKDKTQKSKKFDGS